jgi:hypothetical protein
MDCGATHQLSGRPSGPASSRVQSKHIPSAAAGMPMRNSAGLFNSSLGGVRIVERMLAELKVIDDQQLTPSKNVPGEKFAEGKQDPGTVSATNPFETPNSTVSAKRGRGRPRKYPLPPTTPPTNANGRADRAPKGEP